VHVSETRNKNFEYQGINGKANQTEPEENWLWWHNSG